MRHVFIDKKILYDVSIWSKAQPAHSHIIACKVRSKLCAYTRAHRS